VVRRPGKSHQRLAGHLDILCRICIGGRHSLRRAFQA